MHLVKRLWLFGWKVGLAAGFAGLGVLGIGLMAGALWYSVGLFWGVIVFLLGLIGVLMAISAAMTARNGPQVRSA